VATNHKAGSSNLSEEANQGYIMETAEKSKLLEALKKGTVTVSFRKIDTGELRVMPCTLNPEVLEANGVKNKVDYSSTETEAFPVWSLDKNAWRSFRLDTVEGWEVLGE
jgi:hypothetical protein